MFVKGQILTLWINFLCLYPEHILWQAVCGSVFFFASTKQCCLYLYSSKVRVFQDMWIIIFIVIAMTTCVSTGKHKLSEEVKSYLQEVEAEYCYSQGILLLRPINIASIDNIFMLYCLHVTV